MGPWHPLPPGRKRHKNVRGSPLISCYKKKKPGIQAPPSPFVRISTCAYVLVSSGLRCICKLKYQKGFLPTFEISPITRSPIGDFYRGSKFRQQHFSGILNALYVQCNMCFASVSRIIIASYDLKGLNQIGPSISCYYFSEKKKKYQIFTEKTALALVDPWASRAARV